MCIFSTRSQGSASGDRRLARPGKAIAVSSQMLARLCYKASPIMRISQRFRSSGGFGVRRFATLKRVALSIGAGRVELAGTSAEGGKDLTAARLTIVAPPEGRPFVRYARIRSVKSADGQSQLHPGCAFSRRSKKEIICRQPSFAASASWTGKSGFIQPCAAG